MFQSVDLHLYNTTTKKIGTVYRQFYKMGGDVTKGNKNRIK